MFRKAESDLFIENSFLIHQNDSLLPLVIYMTNNSFSSSR